jgi:4-hydroxybenzoate polyprenyltransferase
MPLLESPPAPSKSRTGWQATVASHRLAEVLLVTGFIGIGSVFAAPLEELFGWRPFAFFSASYLLLLAVYAFNSWAGFDHDRSNPRLTVAASREHFMLAAMLEFGAAVGLFAFWGLHFALLALTIFAMWALYSWPQTGFKYRAFAGTVLHFPIGVLQFLLGFWAFDANVPRALGIGVYFGLILAAGHVNHELIDREADKAAGIKSSAARFGEGLPVAIFTLLVVGSGIVVAVLYHIGWLLPAQAAILLAAVCIQGAGLVVSRFLCKPAKRWLWNRLIYRCGYGLAGLGLVLHGLLS